tara:strand:+ start:86 stop:367 length:282 start_codon:yes stop_codon:yes gene_type:complete
MLSTISLKAFFIYAIVTFPNGEDNLRWHQNYAFKDYATCMTFVSQNVEELAGGLKQLIIMEIGPDKVHLTKLKEIGCSMAPPEEENQAEEIKV